MKHFFQSTFCALSLLSLPASHAQDSEPLVLVETAPVETTLDSPEIPEAAEVWVRMFDSAKERIELAFFYASNAPESRLEEVLLALERAGDRGVRVRGLFDIKFYETYPETIDRLGAQTGIEVRLYDIREKLDGVLHAKYFLVDGREAYVGSQNLDWRSLEHIQELGLRVRVPAVVASLGGLFDYDWALAGGEAPPTAAASLSRPVEASYRGEEIEILPVFSPRALLPEGAEWDLPHLVRWIDEAEERVQIQLLSYKAADRDGFFPDLENALRSAANRGVEVRLLLADWNKRAYTIEGLKSLHVLRNVEVRLTTLPEASTGFIPFARVMHSKAMTIDGRRAWLGTSNWSRDYFFKSRNVGLLLEGESIAQELEAFFQKGWESTYAEPLDPCREYEPPRVSK